MSLVIAVASGLLMLALGANQLAKDGSFWIDEASVALSLLELSPGELFGRLVGGQSFPRFLLLAIDGLVGLFGYETLVARALPHLFFDRVRSRAAAGHEERGADDGGKRAGPPTRNAETCRADPQGVGGQGASHEFSWR